MSKNGGPAFPAGEAPAHPDTSGMSLRDYFAAKAMQGWLASCTQVDVDDIEDADAQAGIAKLAYGLADAMLAERAKAGDQ